MYACESAKTAAGTKSNSTAASIPTDDLIFPSYQRKLMQLRFDFQPFDSAERLVVRDQHGSQRQGVRGDHHVEVPDQAALSFLRGRLANAWPRVAVRLRRATRLRSPRRSRRY